MSKRPVQAADATHAARCVHVSVSIESIQAGGDGHRRKTCCCVTSACAETTHRGRAWCMIGTCGCGQGHSANYNSGGACRRDRHGRTADVSAGAGHVVVKLACSRNHAHDEVRCAMQRS